ncbi:MAG TPA: 4-hydroxybenzoate octaprenyltransferase [Gammaproteobacteria bacterium]
MFSAWPDLKPRFKRWRRTLRDSAFVQRRLPRALERGEQYARLMRIDRPIGAFLLLWPTWWALWIAGSGHPDAEVFVVFTIGVFVMRAAGCVINDFADRKIDARVKRTRDRPLATGKVSAREALVLFFMLLAVAFLLVLTMNRLTIQLSFIGAGLAALYPFTKRWTHLPQPVLGAAFGWAIPMAFAAQLGGVPPVAWLVFIANVLWSTAYDTQYAMVDRDDDLKIGVKSSAILFGEQDRLIIGLLQLTILFNLFLVGRQADLGTPYYYGLGFCAATFAWQQWLIRHRDRESCFRAFLNNNWSGLFLFAGLALSYTLR